MPKRKYTFDNKRPMEERSQAIAEAVIHLTNKLDLYEEDDVNDVTVKKCDRYHFDTVILQFNE